MERREIDRTSLVAGVLFVILGVLFLLEQAGVLDMRPQYVWPLVLIGLGVAILLGGRSRRHGWPRGEVIDTQVAGGEVVESQVVGGHDSAGWSGPEPSASAPGEPKEDTT